MPKIPSDDIMRALAYWRPPGISDDWDGTIRLKMLGVTTKQLRRFKQSRRSLSVNEYTAAKIMMLATTEDKSLCHVLLKMMEAKEPGKRKCQK